MAGRSRLRATRKSPTGGCSISTARSSPVAFRTTRSADLELLDAAVLDPEGAQLARRPRQDQVRPSFPQADVLDVRAGRLGLVGRVRVEDGELVPLVLEEEVVWA